MIVRRRVLIVAAMALLAVSFAAAAAKGKLGFGTEAVFSGFFNPVLKRVKVATVAADSPAAAAGLKPGDCIVEADGQTIEGAPARVMVEKLKHVQPGQHLRLKLKRGESLLNIEIVAGQ